MVDYNKYYGKLMNIDKKKLIINGVIIIGVGITIYLGVKALKKFRSSISEGRIDSNINTQAATVLYNAMNPSGIGWMKSFDTTDTDAIFDVATWKIDLNKVAKEYRNMYNSSLHEDLQKELKVEDYQEFLNLLRGTDGQPQPPEKTDSSLELIAKELYEEMDGISYTRDIAPYEKLENTNDEDFKKVYEIFNEKYGKGETLYEWIKGESISSILWNSGLKFSAIKTDLLNRMEQLGLD